MCKPILVLSQAEQNSGSKKFRPKISGVKKQVCQKNLVKEMWSKIKNLDLKKCIERKISVENNLAPKDLGPKKFGQNIILVLDNSVQK